MVPLILDDTRGPLGRSGPVWFISLVLTLAAGVTFGLVLMLALIGTSSPAAAANTGTPDFGRPIVADNDAPDPAVIRVGNTYVAYTTNANLRRVQIMTSTNLLNWSLVGDALPAVGSWADDRFGMIWAPAVIPSGSGYLLYYVAPDAASGRQCIGLAYASAFSGPFVDSSPTPFMCERNRGGSIDPSVFDQDGSRYFLWKTERNALGLPSQIWSQQLTADGRALVGTRHLLLESDAPWQKANIEGPAMIAEGGGYFLFYSAAYWDRDNYGIGYASCGSPLGPCANRTVAAPWLQDSPYGSAVGGQEFVRDPLGQLWMLYHGWTRAIGYDQGGWRALYAERVTVENGAPRTHNNAQPGGPADPVGAVDLTYASGPNRVRIVGWAIDPNVATSIGVDVYVDGQYKTGGWAAGYRNDLAAAYPLFTGAHGFDLPLGGLSAGAHTACAFALNVGPGGSATAIGCQSLNIVAGFNPALTTNGDGRLEAFAQDASGGLSHAWQQSPGGAWSDWEPSGVAISATPIVALNKGGRLELFATDTRGLLMHSWQVIGAGWSPWESMGAVISSTPVLSQNGDGRLEVFAVDVQGLLIHRWQVIGAGWGPWESMQAAVIGAPAVGANVDGRLEIYARGVGDRLIRSVQMPGIGWRAWQSTGVAATAPPVLATAADGRLEVFSVDGGGGLIHSEQLSRNGSWRWFDWTGGSSRGRPSVVKLPDGRLEVFVIDANNMLAHQWQNAPNGSWSRWESFGLPVTGPPAIIINAVGRLEVFVPGAGGVLYQAAQVPGVGWRPWSNRGVAASDGPAVALNVDGRMAAVALSSNGLVLHSFQQPNQAWTAWSAVASGVF